MIQRKIFTLKRLDYLFCRALTEVEKLLDSLSVGTGYESCVVKVSFTLFRFLGQNVAVISVFSLDFPCAGEREALL